MKVLDEKCLNCGATISFNPKKNKFVCEYCRGEFTIDEIEASKKNKKQIILKKNLTIWKIWKAIIVIIAVLRLLV